MVIAVTLTVRLAVTLRWPRHERYSNHADGALTFSRAKSFFQSNPADKLDDRMRPMTGHSQTGLKRLNWVLACHVALGWLSIRARSLFRRFRKPPS
ncbi:protein of unknown function (plasmid) [Pararobbsia alpina]